MTKTIRFIVRGALVISLIAGGFYAGHGDWGRTLLFMVIVPIFLFIPSWIYERNHKTFFNLTFLAEIEFIVFIGILLAILGESFLYARLPGFDSLVHFTSGVLLTILIVSLNHKRWLDGKFSPIYAVLFGGLLPAMINEVYEWSSDIVLNTQIWGDKFKPLWIDTLSDMILETIGSILAIFILKKYFHRWMERWHHKLPDKTV